MGYDSKKYDFDLEQGSSFSKQLTFYTDEAKTTPEDLSGSTWKMEIRNNADSEIIHTLESPAADGTGIDITDQNVGVIILTLTAEETAAFDFTKAKYDIERINDTIITKPMHGAISFKREITQN